MNYTNVVNAQNPLADQQASPPEAEDSKGASKKETTLPMKYEQLPNVPTMDEIPLLDTKNLSKKDRTPIDYILKGFPLGKVGSVIGTGGISKSQFILMTSFSIAGLDHDLGFGKLTKGKVLILSAEDDLDVLTDRCLAIKELVSSDEEWKEISNNIEIRSLCQFNPDLENDGWLTLISKLCTDKRLVILDTLSMFHNTNEKENNEMSRIIKRMKSIASHRKCSILFIHHTTKESIKDNQGDSKLSARGGIALSDEVRFQINLYPFNKKIHEKEYGELMRNRSYKNFFLWEAVKVNYGKPYGPFLSERISAKSPELEAGFIIQQVKPRGSKIFKKDEFEEAYG